MWLLKVHQCKMMLHLSPELQPLSKNPKEQHKVDFFLKLPCSIFLWHYWSYSEKTVCMHNRCIFVCTYNTGQMVFRKTGYCLSINVLAFETFPYTSYWFIAVYDSTLSYRSVSKTHINRKKWYIYIFFLTRRLCELLKYYSTLWINAYPSNPLHKWPKIVWSNLFSPPHP